VVFRINQGPGKGTLWWPTFFKASQFRLGRLSTLKVRATTFINPERITGGLKVLARRFPLNQLGSFPNGGPFRKFPPSSTQPWWSGFNGYRATYKNYGFRRLFLWHFRGICGFWFWLLKSLPTRLGPRGASGLIRGEGWEFFPFSFFPKGPLNPPFRKAHFISHIQRWEPSQLRAP